MALAPWGKGLEYELQFNPCVPGKWPPEIQVFFRRVPDDAFILKGTFVISLWPITLSPLLLHVESATPQALAQKVWYTRPGQLPLPAVVFSTNELSACILPVGWDLPLTALSFCP